jgi:hypothetical protein
MAGMKMAGKNNSTRKDVRKEMAGKAHHHPFTSPSIKSTHTHTHNNPQHYADHDHEPPP